MPEGLDESKNFMDPGQTDSPEYIGNFLAAQRARDAGAARTQFQPYDKGPVNDNNIPQEEEGGPDFNTVEQNWFNEGDQQSQLIEQQQTDIAAAMSRDAAQKRATRLKIAAQKHKIDKQLSELEQQLENLRRPKGGFLKFNPLDMIDTLMPSLNGKINNAYSSVKSAKGTAKISAIESAVAALKTLKAALIVARLVASVIDAVFKWFGLAAKTRYFGPFFFVPLIILFIVTPLLVPMMAVMYGIFEIGMLTSEIKALRKKINDTLSKLEKELENEKKKMSLRKQRQSLETQEQSFGQPTRFAAPGPASAAAAPKAPPLPPPQKLTA